MDYAVENFETIQPRPQDDVTPTYYGKRTPKDSMIDPLQSIAEQFDLLRVADYERFPAFFDFRGKRYEINLKKTDN